MSSSAKHWLMQRVTAVLLVPFSIYSCIEVLRAFLYYDDRQYAFSFSIPVSGFMLLCLYHGAIGFKVVLDDYISCVMLRMFLVFLVYLVSTLTAIVLILISIGFSFSSIQ